MDKPATFPNFPGLPPGKIPPELKAWCDAVETVLNLQLGRQAKGTNTRAVSIHDLVKAGVVADGVIK